MPGCANHTTRSTVGMLLFSAFVWTCVGCVATAFDLTVLHTNDVHTRFEEVGGDAGGACPPHLAAADDRCFGGEARRTTKVKEIRRAVQNVLLLDAGDRFQGTAWFYAFRGEASAFFMNMIEYDAMAIGNHEFDIGVAGLRPFLLNVTFPALSCNIDGSAEPTIDALIGCKAIMSLPSGDRVGIVGYTLVDTPRYANTGNLVFNPEVDTLQPIVDGLIESGVNAIIALGHSGIETDIEIAKKVRGVDIVIGGHTNTFMYTGEQPSSEVPYSEYPLVVRPDHDPSATVLVASAYAYGKYLGRLDISFDAEGAVTAFGGNPILLDESIQQDNETLNAVRSWRQRVDVVANRIVGTSLVPLRGNKYCYFTECNMGNVLADAMLEPYLNQTAGSWSDVGVAMTTTGSAKADEVKAGDVTLNDLLLNMPYGNTIDVLELRGKHILEMLEHAVRRYEVGGSAGEFLQVSGLLVWYDVSRPVGSRVLSVQVRCAQCEVPSYAPLDGETVYKVAMNSYMAGGGYGFTTGQNKLSQVKGELDVDVTSHYFQAFSPITTGRENRQTIYHGDAPCFQDPATGAGNSLKEQTALVLLFSLAAFKWQSL